MASTLRDRLDVIPRKSLAMRGESLNRRGEATPKKLAALDANQEMGAILARAIELSHLTAKDVAFRLGYADQSQVSRWTAGIEPVRFAALWAVTALRAALVMALAERIEQDVTVQHVVTIRRMAVNE